MSIYDMAQAVPLPAAIEEEAEVCSMLIRGSLDWKAISPLTGEDMSVPVHALIVELANGNEPILGIRDMVKGDRRMWEEFQALKQMRWVPPKKIRANIELIMEVSRRRKLCKVLAVLDLRLRISAITSEEALRELSAAFPPVASETPPAASGPRLVSVPGTGGFSPDDEELWPQVLSPATSGAAAGQGSGSEGARTSPGAKTTPPSAPTSVFRQGTGS